jgi:hypothetical protein
MIESDFVADRRAEIEIRLAPAKSHRLTAMKIAA